jgi:hypothetical protein
MSNQWLSGEVRGGETHVSKRGTPQEKLNEVENADSNVEFIFLRDDNFSAMF